MLNLLTQVPEPSTSVNSLQADKEAGGWGAIEPHALERRPDSTIRFILAAPMS